MADGFLGRWSQRKQAVREGKALEEPVANPVVQQVNGSALESAVDPGLHRDDSPPPPPPSLDDVTGLTTQSDFKPFVARDVAPEVRNAAMKKLFTDPHYNVMDRLDIYIDDYSKPDPLPESMLRQMASAKFLKLFEDQEDEEQGQKDKPDNRVLDDANTPTDDSVAQSAQPPLTDAHQLTDNQPQALGTDDDHTDLRLQPNHATGPQEPGRSTE